MSWMSRLGWKEGLSTPALAEVEKLENEIEKMSKEKNMRLIQFETLELALDKSKRKVEEEKSAALTLQRDMQELNEKLRDLHNKAEKQQQDLTFKDNQITCLQGTLESKVKSLEEAQNAIKKLEEFDPSLSSSVSSSAGGDLSFHSIRSVFSPGSPIRKFQDESVESLKIKLQNAEDAIKKKDRLIDELREEKQNKNEFDLSCSPYSPNSFASRNKASSIIFNENAPTPPIHRRFGSRDSISCTPTRSPDKDLHRQIEDIKENVTMKDQRITGFNISDRLSSDLEAAQLKIRDLETQINENKCKLFNAESSKLSFENKMKDKEAELKAELEDAVSSRDMLRKEMDSLREEMKRSKSDYQASLESLDSERKSMERVYRNERASLDKEIEILSSRANDVTSVKSKFESDMREMESKYLDELRRLSVEKESKSSPFEESTDSRLQTLIEIEIPGLRAEIASKNEKIDTLNRENDNISESLSNARKELVTRTQSLEVEADLVLTELKKELSLKDSRIGELEKLLDYKSTDFQKLSKLESELSKLKDQSLKDQAEWISKIEETELKSKDLNSSLYNAKEDINRLQNEKDSAVKELTKLKEESFEKLGEVREINDSLVRELEEKLLNQSHNVKNLESLLKTLSDASETFKRDRDAALDQKENELNDLKTQLSMAESEYLTKVQTLMEEFQLERESLTSGHIRECEKVKSDTNKRISNMEEENAKKIEDISAEMALKIDEIANLHLKVETFLEDKDNLTSQIRDLQSSYAEKERSLKDQEAYFTEEMRVLQDRIDEKDMKLKEAESRQISAVNECRDLKDKIQSLQTDLQSGSSETESLKDEISFLRETELKPIKNSLATAENKISELTKERDESMQRFEKETLILKNLQLELASSNETVDLKGSELEAVRSELVATKELLSVERADKVDLTEKLNDKLRDILVLQENFNVQIMTLEEDKLELEREKEELSNALPPLKTKIESITTQKEHFESQVKTLRAENRSSDEKIKSLIEEHEARLKSFEGLRDEKDIIQSSLNVFKSENGSMSDRIQYLEKEIDIKDKHLQQTIDEYKAKISDSDFVRNKEKTILVKDKDKLNEKIKELTNNSSNLELEFKNKIEELRKENLELTESNRVLDREKKGYVQKIDLLRRDSSTQLDSIQKSNRQISELRAEYEKDLEKSKALNLELTEEVQTFKVKSQVLFNDHESTKKEFREAAADRDKYLEERNSLEEECNNLRKISSRVDELTSLNESLKDKLIRAERLQEEMKVLLKDKDYELMETVRSRDETQKERKNLSDEILDFEKKYDSLDEKHAALVLEKEDLLLKNSELREEFQTVIKDKTDEFSREREDLIEKISEFQKHSREFETLTKDFKEEKLRLSSELENSQTILISTRSDLDTQTHSCSSLTKELASVHAKNKELSMAKVNLEKSIIASDEAAESLKAKEAECRKQIEELTEKLSTLLVSHGENDTLKKTLEEFEGIISNLRDSVNNLNKEKEELQKTHLVAIADIEDSHQKEKEKIIEKLRSLESSKGDEFDEWRSKLKTALSNLKRKEKELLRLYKENSDLKTSFEKETADMRDEIKKAKGEEEVFPWEKEKDDYKGLSPLDLLFAFRDTELSYRAQAELNSMAVSFLKEDVEAKMERNFELIKELAESKRQYEKHKCQKPFPAPVQDKVLTRSAKRRSMEQGGENWRAEAIPSHERGEETTSNNNPFKKRSILRPATLKFENSAYKKKPLNTITNQPKFDKNKK